MELKSSKYLSLIFPIAIAALFFPVFPALAQFSSHFAVTNVGFSVFCSGTNGTYAYYYGSATTFTNGQIFVTGSRLSVPEGPGSAVPTISNEFASVLQNSSLQGPAWLRTNSSTFTRKIAGRLISLTNEHVSETVFPLVQLTDGALVKAYWSFNVERTQKAKILRGQTNYSWTTNRTWFSGQAFLSISNMTGSVQLGE